MWENQPLQRTIEHSASYSTMSSVKSANLRELVNEGCVFDVSSGVNYGGEEDAYNADDAAKYSNPECVGVFDDMCHEGEPFEVIAAAMENLTPDGKIKKRVLRPGSGGKPLKYATVTVHYNAYLEYDEVPFDSTFIRNKPRKFVLNDGRVIPGLDYGVQSMELGEKAQFMIAPEYAYGKMALLGRVPADRVVLFEVELLRVVNSGATLTYEQLPDEERGSFENTHEYCLALCEKGKQCYADKELKGAITAYNSAVARWEDLVVANKDQIETHREMALKLYSNLLVCYTANGEPRKGCINAQKIYDLTQNAELMKVPAKVYFNHAKCLRSLSEYGKARDMLDKARKLEPKNTEIVKELLALETEKTELRNQRLAFAKALVKGQ